MPSEALTVHAVILAGGRGTRFWPRSRTRTPKQLLNIVGKQTMLEQTVARLRPLIPAERIWTVTNSEQASEVKKQLPAAARKRILTDPWDATPRQRLLSPRCTSDTRRKATHCSPSPRRPLHRQSERYRIIVARRARSRAPQGPHGRPGHSPHPSRNRFRIYRAHGRGSRSKGFPFMRCADSPKNRRFPSQRCTQVPVTITGTPECFLARIHISRKPG